MHVKWEKGMFNWNFSWWSWCRRDGISGFVELLYVFVLCIYKHAYNNWYLSSSVSGEIHTPKLPSHNLLEWFCQEVIQIDLLIQWRWIYNHTDSLIFIETELISKLNIDYFFYLLSDLIWEKNHVIVISQWPEILLLTSRDSIVYWTYRNNVINRKHFKGTMCQIKF